MSLYKESQFPLTYRAAQMRQIMNAISARRSIAVYGFAGMGKSNVLRFLVSHPQIKTHYLGSDAPRFVFAYVDCNLCDPRVENEILAELDAQLERAGLGLPAHARRARQLALRQSIRFRLEAANPAQTIVLVFDPLDLTFESVPAHFWTYLRGLRDLQGNVVYVLGARRPPKPLRELQELLTEACWVTPLNMQDARASLTRDAKRLGVEFSEQDCARLLTLSGGHPGLLKNLADAWRSGVLHAEMSPETLTRAALASDAIAEACRDVWSDLETEWATLHRVALSLPESHSPDATILFLERAGIIEKRAGRYEMFSPLLKAYARAQIPRAIHIVADSSGAARIESWQGVQALKLGDGAMQLLRALAQSPHQVLSRAQLARLLYSGDPNYSNEAVMAHLRRLRKTLNSALRPLTGDANFNAVLSERTHGYRLNRQTKNGWVIEYQLNS